MRRTKRENSKNIHFYRSPITICRCPILAHVLHAICGDLIWLCLHSTRSFWLPRLVRIAVCGVLCVVYHPLDTIPWMYSVECIVTIRLQACSLCVDVFSIDIHRFVSQMQNHHKLLRTELVATGKLDWFICETQSWSRCIGSRVSNEGRERENEIGHNESECVWNSNWSPLNNKILPKFIDTRFESHTHTHTAHLLLPFVCNVTWPNNCPLNIQRTETCEPVRSCALNGTQLKKTANVRIFHSIEFDRLRRIVRHQVRVYPIRFCSHFATAPFYKYKFKRKQLDFQLQQITFLFNKYNAQFNGNPCTAANEYNYSNSIFIIFRMILSLLLR